jgi:hypothetical protein
MISRKTNIDLHTGTTYHLNAKIIAACLVKNPKELCLNKAATNKQVALNDR